MISGWIGRASRTVRLALLFGALAAGLAMPRDPVSAGQGSTQTLGEQAAARDGGFAAASATGVITESMVATDSTDPLDSGGGEYALPGVTELTDDQRREIQAEIDENIRRLGLRGPQGLGPLNVGLSFPLRAASALTDYGFHGVSAFVDHNLSNPNALQDYSCGARTYDYAGYNHKGTDFFTWPFGWSKMDNAEVEIVAVAPGTIVFRQDGNADRSCTMSTSPWNAVFVQHGDGSVTWYGHMKRNSVTPKPVGATVAAGEYLGVVGSSGSSTGPHLHFEVHRAGGALVDPFAGTCNNIASWWTAQRPYYDSAINSLTTGSAAPVFPSCPNPEISNAKDRFNRGDTVYFTTYYRDQLYGQQSQYAVYRPDGTVFRSWTGTLSVSYYAASYWYRSYALAANAPFGRWRFEVVYNGNTYTHTFVVGNVVSLHGRPASEAIWLDWETLAGVPMTGTWKIAYEGVPGVQPSPITEVVSATRAYTLTGLANYTWYTVTVSALIDSAPAMSDTVRVMPTDKFWYLPLVVY